LLINGLHTHGSNNPNGISSNGDRYASILILHFRIWLTIFAFLLALSFIVFFYPNLLGHSDNYIPAILEYSPSIVPE